MSKALMKVGMAIDADTRKEIAQLRAALKPFADEATQWAESVSNAYRLGVTEPKQKFSSGKAVFTIGDLRRAAKLLA